MMRVVAFLLVAFGFVVSVASAGTISMSISHRLEIEAERITAVVTVSNSGDEAAHSVGTVLEIMGTEYRGEPRTSLEPGASYEERLEAPVLGEAEGRWPYRIAVDYTDANQYPFQALSVATFQRGNPPPAEIALTSVTVPGLAQQGVLVAGVKNLSDSERSASLRLVTPRGMEAPNGKTEFSLAPWEDRSLEVSVVNRFALAGSRYPVYAVVEYEEGGLHQAVVASGDLQIIEAGTLDENSRSYVWIAAVVLGLLFFLLLGWKIATR